MQPYLFPYIGYFQLIHACDRFVFYDDVSFIKQGWINRNRYLLQDEPKYFTVPLRNASSHVAIRDVETSTSTDWRSQILAQLTEAYKKAPYFISTLALVEKVFEKPTLSIGELARESILAVCQHLRLQREFIMSSVVYNNSEFRAQDRLLDICRIETAQKYLNPIGGVELYDKRAFAARGVELSFVQTNAIVYPQFDFPFVPHLSIIDVMMFNAPSQIADYLKAYKLI
jgi:hypothetical protein